MSFYAFPNKSDPRIYIPASVVSKMTIDRFLEMYSPFSRNGRLFKNAFMMLPEKLKKLIIKKNETEDKDVEDIYGLVSDILHKLNAEYIPGPIYKGTWGPRRKFTIQICENDKSVGYVKASEKHEAARMIENEYQVLEYLSKIDCGSFCSPMPLGMGKSGNITWMMQKVPADINHSSSYGIGIDEIGKYYDETSSIDKKVLKINDFVSKFDVANLTSEEHDLFDRLVNNLNACWNLNCVVTHFSHGDLVPWNICKLDNSRGLYVFDWEYGSREAPALFDLFHFIVMRWLLIDGEDPLLLAARLLNRKINEMNFILNKSKNIGIDVSHVDAYLSIYLWMMVYRGVIVDANGNREDAPIARNSAFRTMLNFVLNSKKGGRKKILVSAYACEPGRGSEPGVGWNMVKVITKENTAWVITRRKYKESIESEISKNPDPNAHFIYTDLPKALAFWKKGPRGIRTYYYLWQFWAFWKAKKYSRFIDWDVSHHVTFVNDWLFTFLSLMPVPFVWGPIGSHPKIPDGFALNAIQQYKDSMRILFQSIMRYVDPLFWVSFYRASLVIGISKEVFDRGPLRWMAKNKRRIHTAIGIEKEFVKDDIDVETVRSKIRPLNIISIGRLIPIKGFHLALTGFARFIQAGGEGELEIVGKGDELQRLKELAQELCIDERVKFTNWIERNALIDRLASSDVFLYPSFESGGIVVLEAMAAGVPVITSDVGGPGEFVSRANGLVISTKNTKDEFCDRISNALLYLYNHPECRSQLAMKGVNCVKEKYLWEERHKVLRSWYKDVLQNKHSASQEVS